MLSTTCLIWHEALTTSRRADPGFVGDVSCRAEPVAMGISLVVGWFAATFGAGFSLLQLSRTLRTKSTAGVSTTAWLSLSCVAAVWVAYGFHNDVPQQYLPNVPLVLTTCVLGWFHRNKFRTLVPIALLVLAVGSGFVDSNIPGLIGVPLGVSMALPQLIAALRASDLVGISLPAWASQLAAATLWLVFGIGEAKTAIVVTASIQVVLCALLIATLRARRPSSEACSSES
jgi:uncharacterized protein with PQ loop repeat